jgi:hypothetical protein
MNELDMFTALRPEPGPVDVTGSRDKLTAAITETPARRRKTRFVMAGGLATAAAAAAIVVPSVLPGGAGLAKAWAVDRSQDGTVQVTIQQAFGNLAGLQQTLRADGVPAIVKVVPWKITEVNGGTRAVQSCGYASLPAESEAVQHAVITNPVVTGVKAYAGPKDSVRKVKATLPDVSVWTINPAAMPRGSIVFIEASPTVSSTIGGSISNPVVLRSSQLPSCVPGQEVASQWGSK